MAFPESHAEFVGVVASMRELGVLSAFGIVLGPPPAKLEKLEREAAKETGAEERDRLTQELAEERLRLRKQEARDRLALELGASGRTYSDEQLDEMIGPVS